MILAVLLVLILLVAFILVTNKSLSESYIATLTFVLVMVLGPLLILFFARDYFK
jgi:hypothetical protein